MRQGTPESEDSEGCKAKSLTQPSRNPAPPPHPRGFSFIELLVIVAISSALLAIGYPHLASLASKYRLDNTAWKLAAELQNVRQRAIGEASRYRVVFDNSAGTYQIQKETPRESGLFVNQGVAQEVDEAGRVTMTGAPNPVFTSRGTIEAASAGVIALGISPAGNRSLFLQVPGRIHVQ